MLVKIAILFLAGIAAVAMLGNLIFPGALQRRLRGQAHRLSHSGNCRACGRPRIGKGRCPCGKS
jgi:hypothetical protein